MKNTNRKEDICQHCKSKNIKKEDSFRIGDEFHEKFNCKDCNKESYNLFNLEYYNTVTPDEYNNEDDIHLHEFTD